MRWRSSFPLVALVLAVAICALDARVLFGGATWDDVGYHTTIMPPRLAAAAAVWDGDAPGWWDGSGLGVPLAAEPSHGALYPPSWLATTPHAFDALALLHLVWLALGVALWCRRAQGSTLVPLVAGLLVATSGLALGAALRGELFALAHLPWIGAVAERLATHKRASIALALLIGLVGLTGSLAALGDALIVALVIGARRDARGALALGVGAGLALGAAQWLPAIAHLATPRAGASIEGLPLARLLELVVPSSAGLFAGAALLALGAAGTTTRRPAIAIGVFAVLALVVGRGGWPHWLGGPEVHLGALVVLLGAQAGAGIEGLVTGDRVAIRTLLVGAGCALIALIAVAVAREGDAERVVVEAGLGVACLGAAALLAARGSGRTTAVALPLLVMPGIGAHPTLAPTTDRSVVEDPPPWIDAAAPRIARDAPAPARAYRPQLWFAEPPTATVDVVRAPRAFSSAAASEDLADAMATFAGGSAWRWGVAMVPSRDPARSPDVDLAWLAAAREGGALLDRFGVALAIVPESMTEARKLAVKSRRGAWALVELDVAPPAGVLRGALWAAAPADALDLMYPAGGGTGVLRGTVVLGGGGPSQDDRGPPLPCAVASWRAGAIELACTSDVAGYAAVSSSPARGWTATVDGVDTPWLTADVLRRAVPVAAGAHAVSWRYETPLLKSGLVISGLALLFLVAVAITPRRRR